MGGFRDAFLGPALPGVERTGSNLASERKGTAPVLRVSLPSWDRHRPLR